MTAHLCLLAKLSLPSSVRKLTDPDTYHNNFQMPDRFLNAGAMRGRQLQVLVEGTYYLNRLFCTVQMIPKTVVEVGTVGVVVSYTGQMGVDLSGMDYRHGELVETGNRGVWSEPLLPGKYAFNTYAGKVVMVPTTNIILKWIRSEIGSHHFDENLSEVSLITKDAFEPSLPLIGRDPYRLPESPAGHPALWRCKDDWLSKPSTRWFRLTSRTSARPVP